MHAVKLYKNVVFTLCAKALVALVSSGAVGRWLPVLLPRSLSVGSENCASAGHFPWYSFLRGGNWLPWEPGVDVTLQECCDVVSTLSG